MANPTTYFGWVMPTSSSLVTNLPADFNTFGQGVDTSLQDLLGGTTGQVLSKTSNTNMDFTWVTPTDETPLTTKGDLFTFSTVDARLGVGTNGQTLVADSSTATGLKWATPASGSSFAGASVYKSANQTLATATATTLTFDSELLDVGGYHDNSTNNSRITIPSGKAGYYMIQGRVYFDASSVGQRTIFLKLNGGATSIARCDQSITGGSEAQAVAFSQIYNLSVGDYLEIQGYQTTAGNLPVLGLAFLTTFSVNYLGA